MRAKYGNGKTRRRWIGGGGVDVGLCGGRLASACQEVSFIHRECMNMNNLRINHTFCILRINHTHTNPCQCQEEGYTIYAVLLKREDSVDLQARMRANAHARQVQQREDAGRGRRWMRRTRALLQTSWESRLLVACSFIHRE